MVSFRIAFVLFLYLIASSVARTGYFGRCSVKPTPQTVSNFNIPEYMNRWYEQLRDVDSNRFGEAGDCVTATYSLNNDNTVKVQNREYYLYQKTSNSVEGELRCINPDVEAKCKVRFGPKWFGDLGELNYWVLETDYTNYSIVYSCTEFSGFFYGEFLWVLTREANPSTEVWDRINAAVEKSTYPFQSLRKTIHNEDCIYN